MVYLCTMPSLQVSGSYTDGDDVLRNILMPCLPDDFYEQFWEKMPLFISRPCLRQWYSGWLSVENIFELLADQDSDLQYGLNLDVTAYNGQVGLPRTNACPLSRFESTAPPPPCLLPVVIFRHLQERQDFNYNSNPTEEHEVIEAALVRHRFKEVCATPESLD